MLGRSHVRTSAATLMLTPLSAALLLVVPGIPPAAAAGTSTLAASTDAGGAFGAGSSQKPAISADGRFVAFTSTARLDLAGDANSHSDIYRKDLATGQVELVSVNVDGIAGNAESGGEQVAISDDGDVVVFRSSATDLQRVGTQPVNLYHHRVSTGATSQVNTDSAGDIAGAGPDFFSVSADGAKVAFISYTALDGGGSGAYVRDVVAGTTTFVAPALGSQVAISGDGTKVAYLSGMHPSGVACSYCLLRRSAAGAGAETVLNTNTSSNFADPAGLLGPDAMSTSGEQVAFWSDGSAYGVSGTPSDANGVRDVFVYDAAVTTDGPVRRVSEDATGAPETQPSGGTTNDFPKGAVSADGKRVAFTSAADFGVPGATSGGAFVKDRTTGELTVHSIAANGSVAPVANTGLSGDGRVVAFATAAAMTAADDNGATDVFVRGLPLPIDGFSLTVAPSTRRAGVSHIPTGEIDLGLLPVVAGDVASAPLRSSPLRSSPLRSSPLRSSPLRSSPLRSSPLRSSPLRSSPLRSSPVLSADLQLPPMPLSTVPLLLDGGWAPRLVGTPKAGVALQSVTLQEVLVLAQQGGATPTHPQLASLTLADVDLTSTPLRSSPLQAFLFAGPTLQQLSAMDWCAAAPVTGCEPTTWTLLDLVLAGATPPQLAFVPDLLVAEADLSGSPIAHYDVGSVDVEAAGLAAVPVAQLPPGMVDCTLALTSPCTTLGEAVAANAVVADAALSAFGRLLERDDLTGSLTFGHLIRSVVDPAKVSYAGVDLGELVAQAPLDSDRFVTYTAQATVQCAAAEGLQLTVQLPNGFRYVPGSSRLVVDAGEEAALDDPEAPSRDISVARAAPGRELRWPVPLGCDGQTERAMALSFEASPSVHLGVASSSAVLASPAGSASALGTAPVDVQQALEPNDDAGSATTVEPGTLYVSHIAGAGDVDVYRLPSGLPAGTRVTAVLSHLPADFDLFLDGPVAAPLRSSPLRSSPLRSSPLRSSPLEDLGLTGDAGGEVVEPDTLHDVPVDTSVLSRSATAGQADERVTTVLTRPTSDADPATLAVTHHLNSSSPLPYLLQISTDAPPELHCPDPAPVSPFSGTTGTAGALPSVADLSADERAAKRTLFLVNAKRLGDSSSKADADAVLAKLATLSGRPEVGGVVVPVEGDPAVADAYQRWDGSRCDPETANDVVRAIGAVVDRYAAELPGLRYVTFVGDDDIVPFARIPDGATLSNQRDYHPEVVFAGVDNPVSAAYGLGYVLSDNPLLAKAGADFLGHQLTVPDFAGGRLVETPAEIIGTIDQYVAQSHITLDRTLVTGYDFLSDSAASLDAAFSGRTNDRDVLNSANWTREDLKTALQGQPTTAVVNAHFDHSNTLPADGDASGSPTPDLFTTQDLLGSGLPSGALLFTLGCQGGLSVPGRAWAGATPDQAKRMLDFAQAAAQLKANGFFANTGFGYGDTAAIAYSERLLELFTANLDGTMTLSQAVSKAKQDYLAEGMLGVYDEKVLNEATFYGLPFVTVGRSGVAAPAPAAPAPGPATSEQYLGTPVRSFSKAFSYEPVSTARGTYYEVPGEQPLVEHYRPIQPATSEALAAPPSGAVVGDVFFTDLVSLAEEAAPNPVFSVPTVDAGALSPEPLVRDVNFPVSLGAVTPTGSVALFPGQYRSNPAAPGTGTQLRFSSMSYKVFYPSSADAVRPMFTEVDAIVSGSETRFRIGVQSAQHVGVLYKPVGQAQWASTFLTQVSPGTWTGQVGVDVEEYFVQAVNGGRVGTTRAKGLNYTPTPAQVTLTTAQATPVGTPPWYRQPVIVGGAGLEGSVDGAAFEDLPLTVSTDGVHRVEVRPDGGGDVSTLAVPIDQTVPTVTVTHPTQGGTVTSSNRQASFSCGDATSGIASCTALDSTTLNTSSGTHTFRVRAVDHAGNAHTATVEYRGITYEFEGFFSPVDNPAVINVVKAGSNVPVKFRLRQDGQLVTSTAAVASVAAKSITCSTGQADPIEETNPASTPGGLVYDAAAQQFRFNWRTGKTKGCQRLTFTFADGSSRYALFRLE